MTRDEAITLTVGRDMWSTAAAAGAPSARMADGPMGIASGRVDERDISILTPAPVALAATWDRDLVAKVGALVGGEAKRQGVDLLLAPNLNLQRTPTGGRAFELFGEDPLLAGTLGVAWLGGLQSRRVGAVAKHLVCNDSETARDRFSAEIDEAPLREIYLLPFEMAARAGSAGLMAAYNKLNGTHCAEHAHLLTTIVRRDWGYRGFTVSDWFGTVSTAPAMAAGLDLEMPGPARFYGAKLAAAIDAGAVDADVVTDAARRVAEAASLYAGGDSGPEPGDRDAILTEATAASFVLLRNEGGLLPIAPGSVRTLAVIGPNAAAPCLQGGTFAKVSPRPDAVSALDALANAYGADRVRFAPGCDPSPRLPAMRAKATGDGAPGMTVDYFAGHDFTAAPLGSETRNTNSLTWFGGMPGVGAFDRAGGVRASGIVTPAVSGTHRLHIGGTGSVRLLLDGREIFAADRHIAPADIMGVLKGGDSETVDVDLVAGMPVRIDAELRFEPARAQGLWYGLRAPGDAETLLAEAEALAQEADAVLLVLGETADSGVESKDRDTNALPADQQRLAAKVIAANPRVAVAVNVAHAFDSAMADGAAALMVIWYPGEAFGPALADVLTGAREPSGRLPLTIAAHDADYPAFDAIPDAEGRVRYAEGLDVGHRGFTARGIAPAHAFGSGLGYGRVRPTAVHGAATREGGATLTVDCANDGPRDTAAVVQVYREDGALAGFAKAMVAAGDGRSVSIHVDPFALRRWRDGEWHRPSGSHRLLIGTASDDLPLHIDLHFN
ncbi:MAG: glycoside hydrolase family 3 C-terminal domain-containing protein [Sphingomonas adhaesiva]|uniref:glycoside hydrolase family 3 protein n=1 Tax=Sphingomonas adhaesiva TaxID=28212 RepID=UPI002FF56420